jgi:hypothetical protein
MLASGSLSVEPEHLAKKNQTQPDRRKDPSNAMLIVGASAAPSSVCAYASATLVRCLPLTPPGAVWKLSLISRRNADYESRSPASS